LRDCGASKLGQTVSSCQLTEDATAFSGATGTGLPNARVAILAEIAQAKETVQVQAYPFTSVEITKALLKSHKRGVKVTAILDASQQHVRAGMGIIRRRAIASAQPLARRPGRTEGR
jgi:phosphatidylserine/phosphatidylglycerophosphate/cardiolipin synthase-like enzyme